MVELVVVLAIVALLIGLAIPNLLVNRKQAREMETKLNLTNGARVVAALQPELGSYTDDVATLEAASPGLDFSGAEPESIHVVVGDVDPGDAGQVLLYGRSVTGSWFGLRLVLTGPDAGRHTCIGSEADMTLEACSGLTW
jgi:type II secretory pathway pseudopilin PulG